MPGGQRSQPGESPQGGGLAGPVRAQQGDHLAGSDPQPHVETESAPVDDEVGVQAAGHRTAHRSRNAARMVTETTNSTRLSTIAASRSVSSAR